MKKCCTTCLEEKSIDEFGKSKRSKDGYHYDCKKCKNYKSSKYYNKETKRNYYQNNKEIILNKSKSHYYLNKEAKLKYQNFYGKINRDKINEYKRNRFQTDFIFRYIQLIRNIIKKSLKRGGYLKNKTAEKILGCSYQEFQIYIESQFEAWMCWENNGNYTGNYNETWQYDHIIPISSAMTEEEVLKLSHYTNFRPLCSKKNLEKSDKI
jgi:hypothetical protein